MDESPGNRTDKYGTRNPVTRFLVGRFLRSLDDVLRALAPESVFDVGCGEGVVTERVARLLPTASIVGLDLDDARLRTEWARRRGENLAFQAGSAYALPFEDDSFDLVCATEVLEHLERPDAALAEMARVTRGSLLLTVPREPIWRMANVLAGRYVRSLGNTPGHVNHWSRRDFARFVSRVGTVRRLETSFPWTIAVVEAAPAPAAARRASGRVGAPGIDPKVPGRAVRL